MPITVEAVGCTDARVLEEEVDEDLEKFSDFFESLGNDPLSRFERTTIKTYLYWKTHGEPRSSTQTSPTEETNAT